MKKIALLLTIPALLFSYSAVAQNVGINETGNPADASAGLDVDFDDKGFLLPRVALTNTTNQAPIGAPANSLMVYNTATAGDVTPGYYYWNGTIWKRFAESGDAWRIEGNTGTNPNNNFLGTLDNQALAFRTNNSEKMRILTNGLVGIGTTNPLKGLHLSFDNGPDAVIRIENTSANTWDIQSTNAGHLHFINLNNFSVPLHINGANDFIGVGTGTPSERLTVNGNFRLDGAFMPDNNAGSANQLLLSNGAGNAPGWSNFAILNAPAIEAIGKFFTGLFDIDDGVYLTLTVTDPDMTNASSVSVNPTGPLTAGILWGYNFTVMAEPRNGEVIFHIVNITGSNFTNLELVYTAFY